MIRRKYKKRKPNQNRIIANNFIRFARVRVLSEHGESVGIMPVRQALYQAMSQDKDLVLITDKADPPVVKIIELSKYKYQLKRKESKARRANKDQKLKELRFSMFMGEADFETRFKKVMNFLERGDKVRLTLQIKRGRQMSKKDIAYETFAKIFDRTKELAEVEIEPKIVGSKLIAQLSPVGKKKA